MSQPIARRVAAGIQRIIRRDRIAPGGRLPTEHALARRFRVSRPVVREAIQALKALGIVESRPKVGLRVLPFDPGSHFDQMIPRIRTDEERAELYEFRCLLEPALLRLAGRRAAPSQLDELEAMLRVPLREGPAAVREGLARDVAFHEALWQLAGNRFAWSLRGLLVRYFADIERRSGRPLSEATVRKTNRQHLAIVLALKRGEVERAERVLVDNLGTFRPSAHRKAPGAPARRNGRWKDPVVKARAHLPVLTDAARAAIPAVEGDTAGLVADLRRILPPERLLDLPDDLFSYECDGQTLDRALPLAVVFPESAEEMSAAVKACVRRSVPFVARGAGTGLSGGAVAVGSLVLSTARMNRILEIDALNRQAWVQPGVVNAHLSKAVHVHGLHYAPDPSSQYACTIGGNVAENSGGPHTLKYGVTTNHVLGLEVVLPDGSIVRMGGTAADLPGYDLTGLFVGSEGTFGIATRILVRLTPLPEGVKTVLAIFNSVVDACRGVSEILARGILPAAIEMIDQKTLRAVEQYIHAGLPLDAAAVLLVEVDGLVDELEEQAAAVLDACQAARVRDVRLARDEAERALLWKGRKQAFGALGRLAPNYYTHDGVIPRTKLPEVLEEIERIEARHGIMIANVFHAGDGNLHPVVLYDEREPGAIERVRQAGDEILRLVVRVGGGLSGEHGIGLEKISYMREFFDEVDLERMRSVRAVFDPRGLCNPGKAIPSAGRCVEPGGSRRLPVGH